MNEELQFRLVVVENEHVVGNEGAEEVGSLHGMKFIINYVRFYLMLVLLMKTMSFLSREL